MTDKSTIRMLYSWKLYFEYKFYIFIYKAACFTIKIKYTWKYSIECEIKTLQFPR